MIKHLKNRLKKIYLLRQLFRLARKYYYSDPKFISLLTTFEKYSPNSNGEPRLKSKLTKNTINGIFKSINLLFKDLNNSETIVLKLEDLKLNTDEKNSIKELEILLNKYGSDKAYKHKYHILYGKILTPRKKISNILEIGLGTNHRDIVSSMGIKGKPGASLRTFRDFCPNAEIVGADIDKRILFEEDRIKTFYVDQTSPSSLNNLKDKFTNKFDLIIDDGLHSPDANINTLRVATNLIKKGGSIVIEDINSKAIDIWITISNLLPPNIFKSQIIEAEGAILFLVQKI
tara:strand:- start:3962 stop:4825 length:864 start_codon:yes stop_codon:yes gene_type:complete